MFARMRFSDFVIYKALEANTEALRTVSTVEGALTDRQVHQLRLSVKRLRASWWLLQSSVPPDQFRAAQQRLKRIHRSLAGARDERVVASTAAKLAAKAPKKKTRAALEALGEEFAQRASHRRQQQISLDVVAQEFQEESSVWRELDFPDAVDDAVLKAYARTYRHGRDLGRQALAGRDVKDMHEWRRWVKFTYFHLDLIEGVLDEDNLARRWYLDKLGEALGRHNDLDMLRSRLPEAGLSERDVARVDKLAAARMGVYRKRARKLYVRAYGPKPKEFRAAIGRDVTKVARNDLSVIPRTA